MFVSSCWSRTGWSHDKGQTARTCISGSMTSMPGGLFLRQHSPVELRIAVSVNVSPQRQGSENQEPSFNEGDVLVSAGGYSLLGRPVREQVCRLFCHVALLAESGSNLMTISLALSRFTLVTMSSPQDEHFGRAVEHQRPLPTAARAPSDHHPPSSTLSRISQA